MKYWRGCLVATIIAAVTWGLHRFSANHSVLVDMIYPYISRMVQDSLAQWSSAAGLCVWQVILFALIAFAMALLIFAVLRHWNILRVTGWILTGASLLAFLSTGIYGLNQYSGPLADDIRLENAQYAWSINELEAAAVYYRDQANGLANQVDRDGSGNVEKEKFAVLAEQAANGFETLTYERFYSSFAGDPLPVKKLTMSVADGKHFPLTGEAAVNPKLPMLNMPFVMCREMSYRMCIAVEGDAEFAAFMACEANSDVRFRYSGYFMAYRACCNALEQIGETGVLQKVTSGENANLKKDMDQFDKNGKRYDTASGFCDLLVVWHVQTVVLPQQGDQDDRFDPTDETQVDLSGIVNAGG